MGIYMGNSFLDMTPKMQELYMDIMASLGQLPEEIKSYIFGIDEEEDMDWVLLVTNYIIMEYIKYSYDFDDPEYSLRHFLKDSDNYDSERMLHYRIMQYVLKYKKREMDMHPGVIEGKYMNLDMDNIKQKLDGYRLTEMNFYEHESLYKVELFRIITEKRVTSAKKIPNKRFIEMFEEYDKLVEDLIERSKKSDYDMVFASIAFFTLEWRYGIETYYYVACIMEELKTKEFDRDVLVLLCGGLELESRFGGWAKTDRGLIKERFFFIDYFFNENVHLFNKDTLFDMIREIICLGVRYKEGITSIDGDLYKEWFRKESGISDWASFFRYYNIFDIWEKKEWTNARIRNMRHILDTMIIPKI